MLKLTQIIKIALILGIFLQTSQSYKLFDERLQPEGRTKFDDDLREFMEFVKLQMQCGYEPAGVPPLAPYQQDFAKFDLQGGGWRWVWNKN